MTRASKIVPPAVPAWCIARPPLEERLDAALERRLTAVVAEAGFGKSTVLARWAAEVGCAWYTIDESDAALDRLARGVVEALRTRVPHLPADLPESFGAPGGAPSDERERAETLAAHLSEALQAALADDLVMVIDDLQALERGGASARFVEGLCRRAPPSFHLILASRDEIPFPVERLRGRGEVQSIEPAMLAFSEDEVGEVLVTSLGETARGLAGSLYTLTFGWPAAVRLAVETLRGVSADQAPAVLVRMRRPGGPLFAYLAEEVFAGESADVREFLRKTAPFDRFTVELCETLGVARAAETVADLVRRGLFLQPLARNGDDWFAMHALVREFAARAWPLEEGELEALHREAARWFEAHGYFEEALGSLAEAADPPSVARLLAGRGRELLARGAVDGIARLGESLPPELRSAGLEELLGEAHTVRGESTLAQECFRRAAGDAEVLSPGLAWRIGLMHHERGDHAEALAIYGRGRIDGTRPAEEAVLLAAMGSAHVLTGDIVSAERRITEARARAEASGEPRAVGAVHAALMLLETDKDPTASTHHYRVALKAAERAGDVLLAVRIRTNRGSHLDEQGEYAEALAELEIAIRQAELAGYAERLALAFNNRGYTRFHVGHLDEAVTDLEHAKAIYERAGSHRTCWPLMNLGTIYRERGDLALARSVCEEALPLAERMNDVQGLIACLSGLARILALEEPERAERLAERAIEVGRRWGGVVEALLAAGWVALARGRRDHAAALAREAAEKARQRHSRPGLAESLELEAVLAKDPARGRLRVDEAIALWREIGNPLGEARAELARARLFPDPAAEALALRAEGRLQAMGVRPEAAAGAAGLLACLPRETGMPVEVRTFGGFRVLRSGEPVTTSDWQSKKSRDLLKILIARRGVPVPRDVLMEALWPEEPPGPLPKRLSVALATLRGVLDPERQFDSGHFVAADDAAVWVDLDHVAVDVEKFLAESRAGLSLLRRGRSREAQAVLAAAEARYAGDFLEEDLYEEWATGLREEARAAYVSLVRALAKMARATGDAEAAVRYLLRILQRDPYDEEAHLELVATFESAGRRGEARRAYRAYVARMEDLGVEPASMPAALPPAGVARTTGASRRSA